MARALGNGALGHSHCVFQWHARWRCAQWRCAQWWCALLQPLGSGTLSSGAPGQGAHASSSLSLTSPCHFSVEATATERATERAICIEGKGSYLCDVGPVPPSLRIVELALPLFAAVLHVAEHDAFTNSSGAWGS